MDIKLIEATTPYEPITFEYGLLTKDEWLAVKNREGKKFKAFSNHTDSIASMNTSGVFGIFGTTPKDYRVGNNRYIRLRDNDLWPTARISNDGIQVVKHRDPFELPEDIKFSVSDVSVVNEIVFQIPNEVLATFTALNTLTIDGKQVRIFEHPNGVIATYKNYICGYTLDAKSTQLVIADEFRGTKLAKVVTDAHYAKYASTPSGGFTDAGERNSIRAWERRVRKMIANGWYTELIKSGKTTLERVKEIVKDLPKTTKSVKPESPYMLVQTVFAMAIHTPALMDEDGEVDIKELLAYAEVEEANDYVLINRVRSRSSKYDNLCLRMILQLVKKQELPLYADVLTLNYIKAWFRDEVEIDGNFVTPKKDLININALHKSRVSMHDITYYLGDVFEPAFID